MILTADYKSIRISQRRVAFAPADTFENFSLALDVRAKKLEEIVGVIQQNPPRGFFKGDQDIPRFVHEVLVDLDEVLQAATHYAGRRNVF